LHRNEAQYSIALCKRKVVFMKTKLLTVVCVTVIGLCSVNVGHASVDNPADVASDLFVIRPAYFVGTVLGSAVFIVALPWAAISGSVKQNADALVVRPAKMTFIRPVGDLEKSNR
jgi:hypothetical protein